MPTCILQDTGEKMKIKSEKQHNIQFSLETGIVFLGQSLGLD